jgi:hypothetical protein
MGLKFEEFRLDSKQEQDIFLWSKASRPALRSTQPSTSSETEASSWGLNRPGREADYASPYCSDVNKTGNVRIT